VLRGRGKIRDLPISIPIILILFFHSFAQNTIENPEKPENPNSGRIVELKEIMRIHDDAPKYFFRFPRDIKVSKEGFIFVLDFKKLFQFDENGSFIRNLITLGEGPGESESFSDYQLEQDGIVVKSFTPLKFMWFGYDGILIKEYTHLKAITLETFSLFCSGRYYFLESQPPLPSKKTAEVEVNFDLISCGDDFAKKTHHLSYSTRRLIVSEGGSRTAFDLSPHIHAVGQNRYLFIVHTADYRVIVFDALNNRTTAFRRAYHRVKSTKKDRDTGYKINGKPFYLPPAQYKNDVEGLIPAEDSIWVITSTKDEEKGFLIDVFNFEGVFVDSFYLRFPRESAMKKLDYRKIAISDGFLYSIEQDETGLMLIKKYSFNIIN
jgi:mRNA-degrading endonuclease RelE of RelBE toxin-antitoxin system